MSDSPDLAHEIEDIDSEPTSPSGLPEGWELEMLYGRYDDPSAMWMLRAPDGICFDLEASLTPRPEGRWMCRLIHRGDIDYDWDLAQWAEGYGLNDDQRFRTRRELIRVLLATWERGRFDLEPLPYSD